MQVSCLLEVDTDDGRHIETQTPALHLVVRLNNVTVAKLLLSHGADVNALDSEVSMTCPEACSVLFVRALRYRELQLSSCMHILLAHK